MAAPDEARVDATPLLRAWDQLAVENKRVGDYHAAAAFWDMYGELLTARRDIYRQHRNDLQTNTRWETPAAREFYGRVDAGVTSIDSWQPAAMPGIARQLHEAAGAIGPAFQTVDENRAMFSGNGSVMKRYLRSGGDEIPTFRMEGNTVVVYPAGHKAWAEQLIIDSEQAAKDVANRFKAVTTAMAPLRNHQEWNGPRRAPVADPRRAGPGGGPSGPGGGPSGGPGGEPGGPGGGPGGAPGGPGGDEPGGAPGGPAAGESTPDSGLAPAANDPSGMPPLTSDPKLAGTPSATLNPTSNTALNPLPSSSPGLPPSGLPGSNLSTSPVPSVPFTPISTARPSGRSNSTVDGLRGTVPGTSVPAAAEQQVRPRGVPPAGGTSGTGQGFYPPMMPMYPPGGGGGGSGIRPGEAEFSGGPIRHNSGRESWRAGLRPQLLGRADERDDEPPPVQQFSSGEVLDEELWQVPGAAPATPPVPQQRRGRAWP